MSKFDISSLCEELRDVGIYETKNKIVVSRKCSGCKKYHVSNTLKQCSSFLCSKVSCQLCSYFCDGCSSPYCKKCVRVCSGCTAIVCKSCFGKQCDCYVDDSEEALRKDGIGFIEYDNTEDDDDDYIPEFIQNDDEQYGYDTNEDTNSYMDDDMSNDSQTVFNGFGSVPNESPKGNMDDYPTKPYFCIIPSPSKYNTREDTDNDVYMVDRGEDAWCN